METKSLIELSAMSKEELIILILGDENQNTSTCIKSFDSPNGQVSREVVTTDSKGTVISTDIWNWTYKQSGVVDEIFHLKLDDKKNPVLADKIVHSDVSAEKISVDLKKIPKEMLSAREVLDIPIVEEKPIEEKPIDEKEIDSGLEIKAP
jgi:hypothetical protein